MACGERDSGPATHSLPMLGNTIPCLQMINGMHCIPLIICKQGAIHFHATPFPPELISNVKDEPTLFKASQDSQNNEGLGEMEALLRVANQQIAGFASSIWPDLASV